MCGRKLLMACAAAAAIMAGMSGVANAGPAASAMPASGASALPGADWVPGSSAPAQPFPVRLSAGKDLSSTVPAASDDALFPFSKTALAPYESLTDGGGFVSAAIDLASHLQFRISAATLSKEQRLAQSPQVAARALIQGGLMPSQTTAAEAGLNWGFARWGSLGLSADVANEHDALLGGANPASARAAGVGLSARFGLGDGWVTTFAFHQGTTELALRPNFSLNTAGRAYGVTLARQGLFSKNDVVGLAVTRPGPIYNGGIDLAAPTGVDLTRSLVGSTGAIPGSHPETDVELGYVTTFFDGALALQANAGYQMNVRGESGANAVTVLSRAKINF